jgi:hypothetical protein
VNDIRSQEPIMNKLILTAVIAVAMVAGMGRVGRALEQSAARPDFSGKWAVDIQASSPGLVLDGERLVQPFLMTPPKTLQPSFANVFTARQDSETLRVQREIRQGVTMSLTVSYYRLDGSETTNVEGAFTKTASKATWQGGTLTILTRLADTGTIPRLELERLMSLDATGRLLVETKSGGGPAYLTVYRRAQ